MSCVAKFCPSKRSYYYVQNIQDKTGVSMGPISLSFADSELQEDTTDAELTAQMLEEKKNIKSISSTTTEEWRAKYEQDGMVDLWVEEEFNSGSRLKVLVNISATPLLCFSNP